MSIANANEDERTTRRIAFFKKIHEQGSMTDKQVLQFLGFERMSEDGAERAWVIVVSKLLDWNVLTIEDKVFYITPFGRFLFALTEGRTP